MSAEQLVEIGKYLLPTQRFQSNGYLHLQGILKRVESISGTARRAALLSCAIQSNQIFNDGNTRTATAALYALIKEERGQFLRARAYQAYAVVGRYGPQFAEAPEKTMMTVANWIDSKLYGPSDVQAEWATMMSELLTVQEAVAEMMAMNLSDSNRSDPLARALNAQKKSFMRHIGG
jgi:hypothetical protein